MLDITKTTEPKSDQQNYDDYIGGPKVVTVSEVKKGSADQPVEVHLVEFPGRPFKPSKSMRRVLVAAWGGDAENYPGRQLRLYGDPKVKFGGKEVGGIRIAAMSNLTEPITIQLTVTRGSRAPFTVQPLGETDAPAQPDIAQRRKQAIAAFEGIRVSRRQLEEFLEEEIDDWSEENITALVQVFQAITKEGAPPEDYFPTDTVENQEQGA